MTTQRSALRWGWRHVRGSWDQDREQWIVDDFGEEGALVSRAYVNQLIRENDAGYAIWSRRQEGMRQDVHRVSRNTELVCIAAGLSLGVAAALTDLHWLVISGILSQAVGLGMDFIRTKNRRWTPRWPDSGYVSRTLAGTSMENLSEPSVTNR